MGHANADIDSLGSALGIYSLVKSLDKEAYIVNNTIGLSVDNFIEAIDNVISNIVIEKDIFFQILMKIGKIPKTIFREKNEKIYETYMNIIFGKKLLLFI